MKLMVIDGNSIVNRAFYGVRMLNTRDGQPTNAVFGFLTILQKLLDDHKPDALCVTFDLHAPTFRHIEFEAYKAQRKTMPEELVAQMPVLKEVLDAMNIPRYEQEGWEADDLIGTISRICEESGWECAVVTGDKDSLQLLTEQTHVLLVTTRMGQTTTKEMTPETFFETYGFEPSKMVDLKGLMGDPSDNIPGVAGIGEKTAMDLVQRYGTIEEIYAKLDTLEVKPGVLKKLTEGGEMARMCYGLATIHTDAPIGFKPEDALRRPVDHEALYQLFLRLEFNKFIEKFGLSGAAVTPRGNVSVECSTLEIVEMPERAQDLLATWRNRPAVSCLALPTLDAVAVCDKTQGYLFRADVLGESYKSFLNGFFAPGVRKISHDIKTLMGRLLAEGLSTDGFVFDTAIAAYLLAPTDGSYELDKLFLTYFNQKLPPAKAYLDAEAFSPLADHTTAIAALMSHTAAVAALEEELSQRLEDCSLRKLFDTVELPLCPVLAEMEQTGFLVDRKALGAFGLMLTERIASDRDSIYALAGEEFNINSTQQLGTILFDKLGLPPVKKTKTGYSTNAEVLEKLQGEHAIIDVILDYRQLTKLNSTYVEGLSKVIAPDGRIHTCFQNTVTATGRLSSTEPNLQNIPVRTELGAKLREMFVAQKDWVLVDADYSQIELRLLAHIAGDQHMQQAFLTGEDIHTITASKVFGVDPKDVTPNQRRSAKAVNFGIVYGISEFSLSQDIGVTRWEAKEYMQRYFEKYAGVHAYMSDVVEQAKKDGYVATLMGRRRWLPELNSANFNLRSFGERVALNMPIQGTAADVIKLAMIRVHDRLKQEKLQARLVLQVHDELIVECPPEESEQVRALLTREMEGVMALSVPLIAEAAAGKSWAQAH